MYMYLLNKKKIEQDVIVTETHMYANKQTLLEEK